MAFGFTRRVGMRAADDPLTAALRDSRAPVACVVAKSHDRHVEQALRTTLDENLAMVRDTVTHLRAEGQRVFVDCEHFFDGYRENRAYALEVVRTAAEAGRRGRRALRHQRRDAAAVGRRDRGRHGRGSACGSGIHAHNDTGCAVANTLAAVDAGATHVQGTVNGYGERTGNAELISVVANLELKYGWSLLPAGSLREATRLAHAIAEVTNVPSSARQPYVGLSSFAHKAGLHASAIKVDPNLYQHIDPAVVGNDMRMLVSDMAGRANIQIKGSELGFDLSDRDLAARITDQVKEREAAGYTYEAADASFELLLRRELDQLPEYFSVQSWRVFTQGFRAGRPARRADSDTECTVRLTAKGVSQRVVGEGNGPVNALDQAAPQRAAAGLPGGRGVRADRLPRPHPRPGPRHRRHGPGAHPDHRRPSALDHGRASARTSSRPRGRRSATLTSTACCTRTWSPAQLRRPGRGSAQRLGAGDLDRLAADEVLRAQAQLRAAGRAALARDPGRVGVAVADLAAHGERRRVVEERARGDLGRAQVVEQQRADGLPHPGADPRPWWRRASQEPVSARAGDRVVRWR